ncbi:hypothetical protein BN946_scf184573.g8 [Trametes cinnabarina]|uniref:Uncharacterized protein n=1 Tax=Pycnoporus cinnabarinus TaxID=5643 RepID=A0A060S854_PYCCI|nr:hypothetical protein BN946_scf184573.g8 [Trametes cinnabarina]
MLTRYDTLPLIPGSSQSQAPQVSDDYLDPHPGRKLSRSGTELFQDALKLFENINDTSDSRAEPRSRRVVKKRSTRPGLPQAEGPPQVHVTQPTNSRPDNSLRGRTDSLASLSGQVFYPRGSFSQPLDLIPIQSPLENAPPPQFSFDPTVGRLRPCNWSTQVHYGEEEDDADDDDDDELIMPLELSDLIHIRDSASPAPSSPQIGARALRRTSTARSLKREPSAPSPLSRGASVTSVGMPDPSSGSVRRLRRMDAMNNIASSKHK